MKAAKPVAASLTLNPASSGPQAWKSDAPVITCKTMLLRRKGEMLCKNN